MSKLPTKKQSEDSMKENPKKSNRREISKAVGIKGSMRIDLKRILKELALEGKLERKKRSFEDADQLSAVCVLQMMASTSDGDLFARPVDWQGSQPEPIVLMVHSSSDPALGYGDRVLAKTLLVCFFFFHLMFHQYKK